MGHEQGSEGTETIPHGVPLPDDPDHAEFVHPEAQGLIAAVFAVLAVGLIALAPVATRSAPMAKGWWTEPAFWPLLTLSVVFLAAGWQAIGWLRSAVAASDRRVYAERSLWAFGALGPAAAYGAVFLVYLFALPWIGFALASLVFLQVVVWMAGLRTRAWRATAALFVVGVVLVFRVGIDLWFPLAPLYEHLFPDWFVETIAIYL